MISGHNVLSQAVHSGDHMRGAEDAAVTLVEYGDYECPHCRIAHSVVARLLGHFASKLCFVYRNFPLTEIHAHAELAAVAAEAAGALGEFWHMHDALFENQDALRRTDLIGYAVQIGLDEGAFRKQLEARQWLTRVQDDFASGVASQVHGTPTFFINGRRHEGSADFRTLRFAIEAALKFRAEGSTDALA